ncbi:MAG: BatD family protein, partial [Bacteroidetes bacterium]|nr:BatD family protein [Bacteroidota bacterium]
YDMVQPEVNTQTIEKVNGRPYNTHLIRKVQLYPLQDGSYTLDPTEVDNTVHFIRVDNSGSGSRGGSMQQLLDEYMNGYSGGTPEDQQITLATKPVTITVKPLPAAGKPLSFDGAVGRFNIKASLDKRSVGANEIVHLRLTLSGEGNLPLIVTPTVSWPQGIDLYDPSVKEDDDKTVCPIRGTKEFSYAFSVKQPGTITLPSVEFSYFDVKTGTYKSLHTDTLTLEVTKSNTAPKPAAPDTAKTSTSAATVTNSGTPTWLYPTAFGLLVLGLLIVFLRRKKTTPATPPPVETPVASAPAIITDPFEAAKNALNMGDSQLFYRETGKAIWNALAEKLQLGSSQLNKPVVTRLLQEKGASPVLIVQLESILLETEMALYTPVHTENDMKATLAKAEDFVRGISRES